MSTKLSKSINNSIYPAFFSSFSCFLRLLHFLIYFSTLRNWYCRKTIYKFLSQSESVITVLDAGCGAGDFLIPLLKKFPKNKYFGLDKSSGHINACINYLNSSNIENCTLINSDLDLFDFNFSPDIIICITVLQYLNDDEKVLNTFYKNLSSEGHLILYVPVNYTPFFKLYPSIKNYFSSSDYDRNVGIKRQYSTADIINKIEDSGFTIKDKIFAYKLFGKIAFELHSSFLLFILSIPLYCSVFATILYFILIFPFILLLNFVDFYSKNEEGNGILIVAKKMQK